MKRRGLGKNHFVTGRVRGWREMLPEDSGLRAGKGAVSLAELSASARQNFPANDE